MTEAQAVLATLEITPSLRDDATIALLWAWAGLRGNRQVDQWPGPSWPSRALSAVRL